MKFIRDIQVFTAVENDKKKVTYVEQFITAPANEIKLFHCPAGSKIEVVIDEATNTVTANVLGQKMILEYLITVGNFNPFAITKEEYDRIQKYIADA